MIKHLWPFIILVSIYTKSVYSHTAENGLQTKSNNDYVNPYASLIYYDKVTRRFYIKNTNNLQESGRASQTSSFGGFLNNIVKFFTGGFLDTTSRKSRSKRKKHKLSPNDIEDDYFDPIGTIFDGLDTMINGPPKKKNKNKPKVTQVAHSEEQYDYSAEDVSQDIDDNSYENYEDELHATESEFEDESRTEIYQEYHQQQDQEQHQVDPVTITETYKEPEELQTERVEIILPEAVVSEEIQEETAQTEIIKSTTEIYPQLQTETHEEPPISQADLIEYTEEDEPEEMKSIEVVEDIVYKKPESHKVDYKKAILNNINKVRANNITTERLTVITINDTTTIVSSTMRPYRSRKPTRTTTTTTTTTTRRPLPTRRIIYRTTKRTTPKPTTTRRVVTTTTARPTTVRTTTPLFRPYRTKKPTTTTTQRPQYTHRTTLKLHKNVLTTPMPDCIEKKPTPSWMDQIFGQSRRPSYTTQPTIVEKVSTKSPGGWLSFFSTNDENEEEEEVSNDDEENEISDSSSDGWFSSLFSEPKPTKKVTTTTSTTPIPTTTSSPNSWFDTFLSTEEDDGAYIMSNTTSNKKIRNRKTYSGYQLLRVYPNASWKVRALKDMGDDSGESNVIWWSSPSLHKHGDLLVSPKHAEDIKDQLNSEGIDFDVVLWDLQKAIAFENPRLSKTQRLELEKIRGHPMTWRRYHRYADMLRYMEYLSLKYPDIVELIPLGRSSEGMPLIAAKVFIPPEEPHNLGSKKKWTLKSRMKPAIWIDGGWHSREWISPAVVSWILHALVEGAHGQGADRELLKIADWYLLPVGNPDGYEFTHTRDRLWRKTRSRRSTEDFYFTSWFPWNWGEKNCVGVDSNRNWDYQWGGKGSSTDPCSEYYAGPRAFSEPETRAISNFLKENKEQIKVYLSLHSYSQMWVVPSPHSRYALADSEEVMEMGKLAVTALSEVSGTQYRIGTMAQLLQPITGMAHDWAKTKAGIKYSYAVNMRDADGPHGFLLPGSQIVPTARETFEAIKAIADNL